MKTLNFSISASLKEAWHLFKIHWFVLVAAMVISMVVQAAPGFFFHEKSGIPDLISFLISAFFMAGLARILLTTVDGGTPKIEDLFGEAQAYLRMLASIFLTSIAIVIGFVLLIIPGVYVSMRLMFVYTLVIDQGLGAIDAMKKSWSMTEGNVIHLLKLWLTFVGIILLGLLAFFVGVFVAAPVAMLLLTLVYRQAIPKGVVVENADDEPSDALDTEDAEDASSEA